MYQWQIRTNVRNRQNTFHNCWCTIYFDHSQQKVELFKEQKRFEKIGATIEQRFSINEKYFIFINGSIKAQSSWNCKKGGRLNWVELGSSDYESLAKGYDPWGSDDLPA